MIPNQTVNGSKGEKNNKIAYIGKKNSLVKIILGDHGVRLQWQICIIKLDINVLMQVTNFMRKREKHIKISTCLRCAVENYYSNVYAKI